MGEELLKILKDRLIENVNPSKILFHARIECPSGHFSKKNRYTIFKNRRTGSGAIGNSPEINKAQTSYVLQLRTQANHCGLHEPIRSNLHAMFLFYFKNLYVKDKKSKLIRMNEKINDLSNLYELPQDALQKAGIIENDRLICSHDLSRRLEGNRNFLDIFLFEFSDELPLIDYGHKLNSI